MFFFKFIKKFFNNDDLRRKKYGTTPNGIIINCSLDRKGKENEED